MAREKFDFWEILETNIANGTIPRIRQLPVPSSPPSGISKFKEKAELYFQSINVNLFAIRKETEDKTYLEAIENIVEFVKVLRECIVALPC